MKRITLRGVVAALALALASSPLSAAPVVLRASHQFPGGKGDARDEMVQIIARDAKAANVDLDVQVYPGASLFKANEQYWGPDKPKLAEIKLVGRREQGVRSAMLKAGEAHLAFHIAPDEAKQVPRDIVEPTQESVMFRFNPRGRAKWMAARSSRS